SVWASGGHADRYDLFLSLRDGGSAKMRIDGSGTILRTRAEDQWFTAGGIFDNATTLHANLFAGDLGHWLVALSGSLLLSNLILGLCVAWPRRGQWRRSLTTPPAGSGTARIYGWHRLLGLWLAWPAMLVVLFGSLLALSDPLGESLGWKSPQPDLSNPAQFQSDWHTAAVTPADAIAAALALYPGAEFSGMYPPDEEEPWYTVRLLTSDEPQQVYGKTAVVVSPVSGEVLANQPAVEYPVARRLTYSLFPLHTGQIIGLPGRLIGLLSGLFLVTMIVLGACLYWKRRGRS
ncbi:MAG TPA: PepSY-associated TM helix domain-containing protein, partial [Xanthomonadales bacterium]|nr:PepSY-associated TM helix domain-containing protein [Xanthomonadales bacterium]